MKAAEPKVSKVFSPSKMGNLQLRNRIIRAGCFEGMCPGGRVSDALIEHHRAVAAGGAAMTTVAYCSVARDGRAYSHEMWMREEILPDLRRLTDAVHAEGAAASIQLAHCGYFSAPRVIGHQPIGASKVYCLFRQSFPRPMTEDDMREVREQFGKAALLAMKAGFDAVEIHSGHGYLLSQFLSPYTNRRKDQYGGSLENRLRFPKSVVEHVRSVVGPDFPILVKMNTTDGIKGKSFEMGDAVQVARAYEEAGATALIPSCGFTAKNPFLMLRGHLPIRMMAMNQKSWVQRIFTLLFGKFMVPEITYTEMFMLDHARQVLKSVKIPVVLIGGITSLDHMNKAMDEGFSFIQVGRAIIKDPQVINKMQRGEVTASDCDHCNRCVAAMDKDGVRCISNELGLVKKTRKQPYT
jgi:2,4-dienoyl-CoA reductase-like NADH-dependent reductase (Old Yellow Enzyme family)